MSIRRSILLAALTGAALVVAACEGAEPVGATCRLAEPLGPAKIAIESPNLDCVSRACLAVSRGIEPTPTGMCTAGCSADEDCEGEDVSRCEGGFACVVPQVVGPYACRRMCVCVDELDLVPGPQPPAACQDPAATDGA